MRDKMDLEKYIEETIISICNGIGNAKSKVANGAIAPHVITDPKGKTSAVHQVRTFDFEVIVSVNEQNKLEVGGGIKSYISGQKESETSNNMNKVCFSIPFVPEAILPPKNN